MLPNSIHVIARHRDNHKKEKQENRVLDYQMEIIDRKLCDTLFFSIYKASQNNRLVFEGVNWRRNTAATINKIA